MPARRVPPDFGITFLLVSLALTLVSFTVSALLAPKPDLEDARAADLGDFRVPTATEGRVLPLIWGTVVVDGPNVIWYGNLSTQSIKKKVKTGYFSSKRITIGFQYRLSMQFGLCHGVIDGISKIRYGKMFTLYDGGLTKSDILIDLAGLFGGSGDQPGQAGGFQARIVVNDGSQTTRDPHLVAILGSDLLPSYEGTAHLVMKSLSGSSDLGAYVGDTAQLREIEFVTSRFPDNLGLTGNNHIVNSLDANPAEVIYEILTNSDWGLGFGLTEIDLSNFNAVGEQLFTEGQGFSFNLTSSRPAVEIVREVERQIDGVLFLDITSGQFKIKLARADYDIDLVPQLDPSNVVEVKNFKRGDWAETKNEVRVPFNDASQDYKQTYALAQDPANFEIQGERKISTVRFPGVKDGTLASKLAIRELRTLSFPLASATVVVNRTGFDVTPGDVIALTWPDLGLTKLPMRVGDISFGKLSDGKISLTCVQDVFRPETPTMDDAQATNFADPLAGADPLPTTDQRVIELPRLVAHKMDEGSTDLRYHLLALAGDSGGIGSAFTYQVIGDLSPFSSFDLDFGLFDGFASLGQLRSALVGFTDAMPAQGSGSVVVDPAGTNSLDDVIGAILASDTESTFDGVAVIDPGTSDEEWIICTAITDDGGGISLDNVIRGALDTVPKAHSSGAPVWLVWTGGVWPISNEFSPSDIIRLKYLPRSINDFVSEGEATALSDFTLPSTDEDRIGKPYAPNELSINGTTRPTTADADTTLPVAGVPGLELEWTRRDFSASKVINQALGQDDNGNTDWSNLAGENEDLRWRVWLYDLDDTPSPTGRGDAFLMLTTASGAQVSGIEIERDNDIRSNTVSGDVPTSMMFEIESFHDHPAADNRAFEPLFFTCGVTSTTQP